MATDHAQPFSNAIASRNSLLIERRSRDRKVASSNPGRSGGRIFFSSQLCVLTLSVCSTPVLLQCHVKDPGHSAKSAGGRLHRNMHTPLTQQNQRGLTMPLSRHSVGTLSGNKLACNSSGNAQSQLSQLAEPLCTDPGIKNGISVHELISIKKNIKKAQVGNRLSNILPKSWHVRKKLPPQTRE